MPEQIRVRLRIRSERVVTYLVGGASLALFRHGAVARAKARRDVSNWYFTFGYSEVRSKRGVHITCDDDQRGRRVVKHRVQVGHDKRSLLRVGTGTDVKMQVRLWRLQVLEEDLGHVEVVVLPCVDKGVRNSTEDCPVRRVTFERTQSAQPS